MADTPTQAQWLIDNLSPHSSVGVDSSLYTKGTWDNMANQLTARNLTLVATNSNLVDEIWEADGKPPCSNNSIFNLGLEFAGKNSSEKVSDVRQEMMDNNASVLLLTELDEVACKQPKLSWTLKLNIMGLSNEIRFPFHRAPELERQWYSIELYFLCICRNDANQFQFFCQPRSSEF